jgi:hypothetical protein
VGQRIFAFFGEERVVTEDVPVSGQAEVQYAEIADLRHVPLDRLPAEPECSDIVNRILGKQRFTPRVDVATFDSAI